MKITHKISMDLDRYSVPGFDTVWGDRNTRELEITLYAGGSAWEPPADTAVTVRYQKPDGTSGSYDLLPDGTAAWTVSGNAVTVVMAPQTMTAPGCVLLTVCLTAGDREISTFQILMNVRGAVGLELSESGDYWYLSGSLPQPVNAAVGEVLAVKAVDGQGRVTALETAEVSGLTDAQVSALEELLKLAAYTSDPTGAWAAFRAAFGRDDAVPAAGITLSAMVLALSADATGQLTATVIPEDTTDTVVWSSSDESVATVQGGLVTAVGSGDCTITATAGAVSASCSVSVSSADDLVHTHSYTSTVTTEATCETAGVRTYTCLCGDSYTEQISALGHNYVDGVCTRCGAAEPGTAFYDVEWIQKDGYYKNGTIATFSGVYNTGLIAVGNATQWYFKWGRDANYYAAYFDRDKNYLSQLSGWWVAGEKTAEFPADAAYFAPAYYLDDIDNIEIKVNADQVRYTIDNALVSDSLAVTNVIRGTAYTAALDSAPTAITMGGVDITADAYADGVVTIESVTGDVVIV